jgi:hypothetical protein
MLCGITSRTADSCSLGTQEESEEAEEEEKGGIRAREREATKEKLSQATQLESVGLTRGLWTQLANALMWERLGFQLHAMTRWTAVHLESAFSRW